MKIVIAAGHTLNGRGSGAIGVLNESIEVRKIAKKVAHLLKTCGEEVLYLQIDKHDNYKGENYINRVKETNSWSADLYVEIHLNCGGGCGTEVYTWQGENIKEAKDILNNISSLGYKNRGIKDGSDLYVINHTKCTALLVECFFCDSEKDSELYNIDSIAKAIAKGILVQAFFNNKNISEKPKTKYTVNYCLAFQKWYNNVTKTRAPLEENGIYCSNTEKAMQAMQNIIREF